VKRLGMILVGSLTTVALTATAALAQYPPSKPPATIPDDPRPPVAFTGANISLGMIILVALLIVGTVLLLATRRRKVANSK
jgi:hypothetical protein